MKLLVAYDGSECADAAIADLARAGLGPTGEAVVLCVAYQEAPAWALVGGEGFQVADLEAMRIRGNEEEFGRARVIAGRGATQLRKILPEWHVAEETSGGLPASEIVEKAGQWPADLLVIGSHGRTGLSRLLLGGVSHKVLTHAACSVRVGRVRKGRETEDPSQVRGLNVLIGYDRSPSAEAAVDAVCERYWPVGTEIRLVMAVDAQLSSTMPIYPAPLAVGSDLIERAEQCLDDAALKLKDAGLLAIPCAAIDEPRHLLVKDAEKWAADCIFVGSHGMSAIRRLLLGSTSIAVAETAPCPVEVIRYREEPE